MSDRIRVHEWLFLSTCAIAGISLGSSSMADYGKYDVIRNPDSYVVVNMQTHEWVTKPTSDREKAHRQAQELQKRDAQYPAPPADPKPGEFEPGDEPAP